MTPLTHKPVTDRTPETHTDIWTDPRYTTYCRDPETGRRWLHI